MKIPREFQHELFVYISFEIQHGDPIHAAAELGQRCGLFTRRWFGCIEVSYTEHQAHLSELVSWSERLGKHVGEFFLNQKEG